MHDEEVVLVRLDQIKPWPGNPKDHDIGAIIVSMRSFDFTRPARIDKATGRLVAGHGRDQALTVMMAAGEQPPAGVEVDDDGMWKIPAYITPFDSEAEAEGFLIADNQTPIRGGWKDGELLAALQHLSSDDRLLAATGFDEMDIATLASSVFTGTTFPVIHHEPPPPRGVVFFRIYEMDLADEAIAAIQSLCEGNPEWHAKVV